MRAITTSLKQARRQAVFRAPLRVQQKSRLFAMAVASSQPMDFQAGSPSTFCNLTQQQQYPTDEFLSNYQSISIPVVETNRYYFDFAKDKIGHGFFADVYKAIDATSRRSVAVKVINKKKCPEEIFVQELEVMDQIKKTVRKNTSALALHRDVFETETSVNVIFDLFSGGDVFDEVVDHGALSEHEAMALMKRVLPSIGALHDSGFVHRDIKLENILLPKASSRFERLQNASLGDYGYAAKVGTKDSFSNPAGTFGYVAPEALSARRYTPACDVWSLGTVLFTAVAGYQPFPYQNPVGSSDLLGSKEYIERELEAIRFGTSPNTWISEMEKPQFQDKSAAFKDLLKKMLHPVCEERISVAEVLEHPWLTAGESDDVVDSCSLIRRDVSLF